jgi:hypothetical protein
MISGQGHDYDLIVNDIPCQVKTVYWKKYKHNPVLTT